MAESIKPVIKLEKKTVVKDQDNVDIRYELKLPEYQQAIIIKSDYVDDLIKQLTLLKKG